MRLLLLLLLLLLPLPPALPLRPRPRLFCCPGLIPNSPGYVSENLVLAPAPTSGAQVALQSKSVETNPLLFWVLKKDTRTGGCPVNHHPLGVFQETEPLRIESSSRPAIRR
ncbi:hypothetical protein [Hoeflea marina]|uniref:hypothetical protein n=1 Tax=Hoeflea marina TaxID=274592 RepID=UPI001475AE89|nr:hypothetical protein [Hoeflea marina]